MLAIQRLLKQAATFVTLRSLSKAFKTIISYLQKFYIDNIQATQVQSYIAICPEHDRYYQQVIAVVFL